MAKIILVSGVGNSGKTKSIRLFLEKRGILFPDHPRDVLLILPVHKNGHIVLVGIASGGDTIGVVKKNFAFFDDQKCDYFVCASKSSGKTIAHIKAIGLAPGNQFAPIFTKRIFPFLIGSAYADNQKVSGEIESNI